MFPGVSTSSAGAKQTKGLGQHPVAIDIENAGPEGSTTSTTPATVPAVPSGGLSAAVTAYVAEFSKPSPAPSLVPWFAPTFKPLVTHKKVTHPLCAFV